MGMFDIFIKELSSPSFLGPVPLKKFNFYENEPIHGIRYEKSRRRALDSIRGSPRLCGFFERQ